jgi:hypothetical protein
LMHEWGYTTNSQQQKSANMLASTNPFIPTPY